MSKRNKCKAKTNKGKRCSKIAKQDCAGYCGQHHRLYFDGHTVGLCLAKTRKGLWCKNRVHEGYNGYCGIHRRLASSRSWGKIGNRSKAIIKIMTEVAGIAAFIRLVLEGIYFLLQSDIFRSNFMQFATPMQVGTKVFDLTHEQEQEAGRIYSECEELIDDIDTGVAPGHHLYEIRRSFKEWRSSLDDEHVLQTAIAIRVILQYRNAIQRDPLERLGLLGLIMILGGAVGPVQDLSTRQLYAALNICNTIIPYRLNRRFR